MIREINLIEYLPPFIQEYREIKEIIAAENPEFQKIADESEIIKNNQFIDTADEKGIKKIEDMLGIKALDDDTLDNRKFKLLSIWNNAIPYSVRALKEKLAVLCGPDGYSLNVTYDTYTVTIRVALQNKKNYSQVERIVNSFVPCNMLIKLSLLYNTHEILSQFTHEQLSQFTHDQLRNEVLA